MPAQVAVLNHAGDVVLVNVAWRDFADRAQCGQCAEGVNFFAVCARATGPDAVDARRAAHGVREVLAGSRDEFVMDVRCEAPDGVRWYTEQVVPLSGDEPGAVISFTDITARKELEDLTAYQATHDPLTALPNRVLIHDRLT